MEDSDAPFGMSNIQQYNNSRKEGTDAGDGGTVGPREMQEEWRCASVA